MNVSASPAPTSTRAAMASGSPVASASRSWPAAIVSAPSDHEPPRPEPVEQHPDRHLQDRVDQELEHDEPGQHRGRRVEAGGRVESGDPERRAVHDPDEVGGEADGPDEPDAT